MNKEMQPVREAQGKPIELTEGVPAPYSSGRGGIMPETGGEEIPTGGSVGGEAPKSPIDIKTQEIAGKLKGSGIDIDDRGMETVRKMAELGIEPMAGGSDDESPAPLAGPTPEPEPGEVPHGAPLSPEPTISVLDIPGYVEKKHTTKEERARDEEAKRRLDRLAGAGKTRTTEGRIPPEIPTAASPEPSGPYRRGGREAAAFSPIDPSEFSDPEILKIVTDLNAVGERIIYDTELITEWEDRVNSRSSVPGVSPEEITKIRTLLNETSRYASLRSRETSGESQETFRLYLTPEDFKALDKNPMVWLASQIDRIYEYSSEGQEQDSPMIGAVQQLQEVAGRYLAGTERVRKNPDLLKKFNEEFNHGLFMMFARSAIQRRNMEGIGGIAERLGTHGILNTLTFEHGLVNRMHNSIQEHYDDIRVRLKRHHITPEEHANIQGMVRAEYIDLIEYDPDLLSEILPDEPMSAARRSKLIEATIVRAVGTAYNHFVASQREAVIIARGEALFIKKDLDGILADPSGLFMMFNYEQLLVAKFGLLNEEEEKFFSALKRRYAESVLRSKKGFNMDEWIRERVRFDPSLRDNENIQEAALISYGQGLMKDIMLVNDFYSAGWRTEFFLDQIDDVFKYQIAQRDGIANINSLNGTQIAEAEAMASNFGLFMRLRFIHAGSRYEDEADHEHPITKEKAKLETWTKIAKYRPEDIVKIFREKAPGELASLNTSLERLGISLTDDERSQGLTHYDKFKDEYGKALRLVREKGFSKNLPEQIDFSKITSNAEYAKLLDKILGDGSAENVEKIFKELNKFAGSGEVIDRLMYDTKFEDIYSRTYSVDDVLLDKLENVDTEAGLVPISRRLGPEAGGDAYKRVFNDATAAAEGHTAFLHFLMADNIEDRLKAIKEAAERVERYSGPGAGAKVFRYTFGGYLLMGAITDESKLGTFYEVFDIKKLPLRKPINELQRIFGPQAEAFNNDQMLEFLDKYRSDFVGKGEEAEKLWDDMRKLARIRPGDRLRFMAHRAWIYALIYLMMETTYSTYKSVKEGLAAEELKAA